VRAADVGVDKRENYKDGMGSYEDTDGCDDDGKLASLTAYMGMFNLLPAHWFGSRNWIACT
jgi:hypothetical protein